MDYIDYLSITNRPRFGKGWKVVEGETGPEMFVYRVGKVYDDFTHDTFVVTVGNETATWTFRDQEKNQAVLTIEVEN